MYESSYNLLNTDEKSLLHKKYYIELDSKYYGKEIGNLCSLLPEDVCFSLAFVMLLFCYVYTLILVIIVLKIVLTIV